MADDLELVVRSIAGEGPSPDFVATLRERVVAEAEATTSPVVLEDQPVRQLDLRPEPEEHPMTKTRGIAAGLAAVAAVIALIVGLAALIRDGGPETTDPQEQSTTAVPTTTATPATTLEAVAVGADADAGCGLSESASVTAAVDPSGESVTFDVTSDPACSGVDVKVVATPATQGFPIEKNATLDDTGAASVTDHLLSTRKGEQDWSVELIVRDTGGVAATGDFAVMGICDLEAADLQATYLPETNEVNIVLTVDPLCAGESFAFDSGGLFASSPPGGWTTYTVDEDGRIEVTERLVTSRSVIDIDAIPAPADRGILTGRVARVTLDIGD